MKEVSERVFVDTNVLVYAYDSSQARKRLRARDLMYELWLTNAGCLSVQVLLEFCVSVTRKIPRPLDSSKVQEVVRDLAAWRVHSPTPEDILQALDIHRTYQISIWDAMIIRSAAQLGCGKILSEDLSPGQSYAGVQVVNPFS